MGSIKSKLNYGLAVSGEAVPLLLGTDKGFGVFKYFEDNVGIDKVPGRIYIPAMQSAALFDCGLMWTEDEGETWEFEMIPESSVRRVLTDGWGRIYAIANRLRIKETNDYGQTWSFVSPMIGSGTATYTGAAVTDGQGSWVIHTTFGGSTAGAYSWDNGKNWANSTNILDIQPWGFRCFIGGSPLDSGRQIRKYEKSPTSNSALTSLLHTIPEGFQIRFVFTDEVRGRILVGSYGSTSGSFAVAITRSLDGGDSWVDETATVASGNVKHGPYTLNPDTGTIICGRGFVTEGGTHPVTAIARSTDGGITWVNCSGGSGATDHSVPVYMGGNRWLVFPRTLTTEGDIYESVDDGESFSVLKQNGIAPRNMSTVGLYASKPIYVPALKENQIPLIPLTDARSSKLRVTTNAGTYSLAKELT